MKHIFKSATVQKHIDNRIEHCDGIELHLIDEAESIEKLEQFESFLRANAEHIVGVHFPMNTFPEELPDYSIISLLFHTEKLFRLARTINRVSKEVGKSFYVVMHYRMMPGIYKSEQFKEIFLEFTKILDNCTILIENTMSVTRERRENKLKHIQTFEFNLNAYLGFVAYYRDLGVENVGLIVDIQHLLTTIRLNVILENEFNFGLDLDFLSFLEEASAYCEHVHISGFLDLGLFNHGISLDKTPEMTKYVVQYVEHLMKGSEDFNIIHEAYEKDYNYCENAIKNKEEFVHGCDKFCREFFKEEY